jgi:hypothetical protein
MAQLALGLAGAAVGSFFGMPQLGWALGSGIGALVSQPSQPKPQVGNLAPSEVEYGWPIPRYYGTNRAPTWRAWQSELTAIPIEAETGKGSSQVVGYRYTCHMGLLLSEYGPTDMLRIWRNKQLVATFRADSEPEDIAESLSNQYWSMVTFYRGDEDQLPHPTYEAIVGVDNAVAYIGRAMLWIDDALCEGTTPPLIEVEIVADPTRDADSFEMWQFDALALPLGDMTAAPGSPDWTQQRPFLIPLRTVTFNVFSDGTNPTVSLDTYAEAYAMGVELGPGVLESLGETLISVGAPMLVSSVQTGGQVVDTYHIPGVTFAEVEEVYNNETYIFLITYFAGLNVLTPSDPFLGRVITTGNELSGVDAGTNGTAVNGGSSDEPWVSTIYSTGGDTYSRAGPVPGSFVDYLIEGSAGIAKYAKRGSHFFVAQSDATPEVRKFDVGNGTAVASSAAMAAGVTDVATDGTTVFVAVGSDVVRLNYSDLTSAGSNIAYPGGRLFVNSLGDLYAFDTSETLHRYNGSTWDEVMDLGGTLFNTSVMNHPPAYEGGALYAIQSMTGPTGYTSYRGVMSIPLLETEGTTVNDILLPELLRCGVLEDQIDLSETDAIPLLGSGAITHSCAQVAEFLMTYANFTLVVDSALRSILYGQASVATVVYDDLGAGVDQAKEEALEFDQGPAVEQARRYALTVADGEADHQNLTVEDDRIISASSETRATSMPLGMTSERAKGVVNSMAASARTAADTFKTSMALGDLTEPDLGDVITSTGRGDETYRWRLMRETFADWVRDLEGPMDSAADYQDTGSTSAASEPTLTVPTTGGADLIVLDVPLLRDQDNTDGLYAAVDLLGGASQAMLYVSSDGLVYQPLLNATADATVGRVSGVMGPWNGRHQWDRHTTVTVELTGGTLSSSTEAAMQADESINLAAIGHPSRGFELVRFRDADLVATNTYELSTLIRVHRGSDEFGTHLLGDYFVLLNQAGGTRSIELSGANVGLTRFWKAVVPGRTLDGAVAVEAEFQSIRTKPLSCTRLVCERDGSLNATLRCSPRTRLATNYVTVSGIYAPDSEGGDRFAWEVYADAAFSSVVHAAETVLPELPYTAAEQTADGFTAGDDLAVRVYKIGAGGRRGAVLEGVL